MVRPSSPPSPSPAPAAAPPYPSSPHLKPLKTSLKWCAPADRPSSALSPPHHHHHHHHHHACDPSSAMEDPLQSGLQKLIKSAVDPGVYDSQDQVNSTTYHARDCILLQPKGEDQGNGNLPQRSCKFLKEDATLMQGCDKCCQGSGKSEENHSGDQEEINGEASKEGDGKVDQESHRKIHHKKGLHENTSDEDQHLRQGENLYSTSNLIMNDGTADQMNLMQIPQKVGNSFSTCGRQRLQRHWMEAGGNVCIPEIWGREQHLEEWVTYGIVEDALRPAGLMAARAALISTDVRRRKSSSAASSSTSASPNNRSSSSSRRPLITADVGVS